MYRPFYLYARLRDTGYTPEEFAQQEGLHIVGTRDFKRPLHGAYLPTHGVILVNNTLLSRERQWTLWHELFHHYAYTEAWRFLDTDDEDTYANLFAATWFTLRGREVPEGVELRRLIGFLERLIHLHGGLLNEFDFPRQEKFDMVLFDRQRQDSTGKIAPN